MSITYLINMSLLIYVTLMVGMLVAAWYLCDRRNTTSPKTIVECKMANLKKGDR